MNFDSLPFGAQTSILGTLLVIVMWVIWLVLSGRLVPRSQLEDAQKTADRFEHAWEVTQENQKNLADAITDIGALTNTFAHFIDSLPGQGNTGVNHPGGGPDVA